MKDRQLSQPFEFLWRLPADGFEWVRAKPVLSDETRKDWFLVEKRVPPLRTNVYKPLESCTGLFRTFAETSATREGILQFANLYGSLGEPWSQGIIQTGEKTQPVLTGENFMGWKSEILLMHELVLLWDAARAGDTNTLKRFINWNNGAVFCEVRTAITEKRKLLAAPGLNPEILARFKPHDVIQPARYALQKITNEQLVNHPATPRLLWNKRADLQLFMCPRTLNAALWVQFASAVGSNHSYRMCEACGKWFQVGPDGDRRADAEFCSNSCRQKKYRQNQKRGAK